MLITRIKCCAVFKWSISVNLCSILSDKNRNKKKNCRKKVNKIKMASGDGRIMLDSIEMDSLSTKNTDFKTNSMTKTSESEDDGNLIIYFVYWLFYRRFSKPI